MAFNQEIFDAVLEEVATSSVSLLNICKEKGISSRTFWRWIRDDETLRREYTRAKEEQAEFLADQIIEIADDTTHDTKVVEKNGQVFEQENTEWVNRSKLRVEARKWAASKLKPKTYGDKLDITTDGNEIKAIPVVLKDGKSLEDLMSELEPE